MKKYIILFILISIILIIIMIKTETVIYNDPWEESYVHWTDQINIKISKYKPYFLPEINQENYELVYKINENNELAYNLYKYDNFDVVESDLHSGHPHTVHDLRFSFEKTNKKLNFLKRIEADYNININNISYKNDYCVYDNHLFKLPRLYNTYTVYFLWDGESEDIIQYTNEILDDIKYVKIPPTYTNVSIFACPLTNSTLLYIYFEDKKNSYIITMKSYSNFPLLKEFK